MLVNLLYKNTKPETNSSTPLSTYTNPSIPILDNSKLDFSWTREEELDRGVLELVGVNFLIDLYPFFTIIIFFNFNYNSLILGDTPPLEAKKQKIIFTLC